MPQPQAQPRGLMLPRCWLQMQVGSPHRYRLWAAPVFTGCGSELALARRIPLWYIPAVSLIHLENLTRRYGSRRGVERVSLSVPEGALFGFLGPNGAGKTTTIRVMLGFLRPTAGVARIFGLDCWRDSKAIKRDIGYVPGDLRLPAWMDGSNALSIFGADRAVVVTR